MMIPEMVLSFRRDSHVSARIFQSLYDMSSENFVNGLIISGLQIFFSSGAMFNISFLSVEITAPDFGSSLEEIVPPVIMIATVGREDLVRISDFGFRIACLWVFIISADRISDSLIPMLYPDFNFSRIISGSWDSRAWPCHSFVFVFREIRSPGWKVLVFIVVLIFLPSHLVLIFSCFYHEGLCRLSFLVIDMVLRIGRKMLNLQSYKLLFPSKLSSRILVPLVEFLCS